MSYTKKQLENNEANSKIDKKPRNIFTYNLSNNAFIHNLFGNIYKHNTSLRFVFILVLSVGFLSSQMLLNYINCISVSALGYTNQVTTTFNIMDSLSISVSNTNLSITDLAPNQSKDSNVIDIVVNSNNESGYVLGATVGDSTYNTTNLVDAANSANYFTSLADSDNATTNLTSITSNKWGYARSLDGSTWSNYNGLPLYTGTSATLKETTTAVANDTTKFKIAARASNTKTAGTYQNVVNFTATNKPKPIKDPEPAPTINEVFATTNKPKLNGYYKMQDMTGDICSKVTATGESTIAKLIDIRDNRTYNVAKLVDNKCWMLDNLAFNGKDNQGNGSYVTLNSNNTNVTNTVTPDSSWNWTPGESYTTPKIGTGKLGSIPTDTVSTNGSFDAGAHYNYCAASAQTVCEGSYDSAPDTSNDICPKGWHLPSTKDASSDIMTLYTALGGTSTSTTNNETFSALVRNYLHLPLAGLYYSEPVRGFGSYGGFWSSTYYDSLIMYYLYFDTSNVYTQSDSYRFYGFSVRCVTAGA